MRITCPACASAYDVPDARIVPNRAVRCARCGADWTPLSGPAAPGPAMSGPALSSLSAPPPAAPPAAVPEIAPPQAAPATEAPALSAAALLARAIPPKLPDDAAKLAPGNRGWGVAAAWAASVSLLLLGAAAAVHWRTDVMAAWPPSERLYAALGLLGR